jgi:putative tryptophan/tyrosine transport system substrate-binding protein
MRRREFVTLLGGAAAWPLTVRAQEAGRSYRLGFLLPIGRDTPTVAAALDELRRFGFVEGENLTIVPGGFDVSTDLLPESAAAIVKAEPDAIVSGPDLYTRALQQATRTIPLIGMTEDMVGGGLVVSLARPGGNTTGISLLSPELDGKRQDLLIQTVPGMRRLAALADTNVTAARHLQQLGDEARPRGVELMIFSVKRRQDIGPAIDHAKASSAEALNFLATPLFFANTREVVEHVAAAHLPAMFQWPEMAEAGGLAAYGPRIADLYRQRARMVVKVLRGTSPADLPVEQPTKFELVINLKTAKALGLAIPPTLLTRADQVIE